MASAVRTIGEAPVASTVCASERLVCAADRPVGERHTSVAPAVGLLLGLDPKASFALVPV